METIKPRLCEDKMLFNGKWALMNLEARQNQQYIGVNAQLNIITIFLR